MMPDIREMPITLYDRNNEFVSKAVIKRDFNMPSPLIILHANTAYVRGREGVYAEAQNVHHLDEIEVMK